MTDRTKGHARSSVSKLSEVRPRNLGHTRHTLPQVRFRLLMKERSEE